MPIYVAPRAASPQRELSSAATRFEGADCDWRNFFNLHSLLSRAKMCAAINFCGGIYGASFSYGFYGAIYAFRRWLRLPVRGSRLSQEQTQPQRPH
jgi:hypothetical protein